MPIKGSFGPPSGGRRSFPLLRTGAGIAALACATLPAAACGRETPPTIGVASRPELVDATRLAIEDAMARGAFPLDTIMVAEEPGSTTRAIRSAERFVAVPSLLAVVGHVNSAASLVAARVYNENGVIQLAPTTTAAAYREMGPYSFRLVPADDRQGRFLADRLAAEFPDGARLAILYVNDDYGRGLRKSVGEGLDGAAFEVVLDLPHVDGDPARFDVASTVGSLRAADPDVVLWLARAGTLDRLLGELGRAGIRTPVLASDASASAVQYSNEDGRWDGVRYVDFVDMESTPGLRSFRDRYREHYGADVSGLDALHYDAMAVLLEAVRAGTRTPDDLREYLLSLGRDRPPHEGVTGRIMFAPDGESDRSYVLLEIDADAQAGVR